MSARALGVMNDGKLTQFGIRKKENILVHVIKISRRRTGLRYCYTLGPGSLHHQALLFSVWLHVHILSERLKSRGRRSLSFIAHNVLELNHGRGIIGLTWICAHPCTLSKPCCHRGVVCGMARPGPRALSPLPPLDKKQTNNDE